jgi:TRAP-type C4-dicarboxylate transport system permease small subunit
VSDQQGAEGPHPHAPDRDEGALDGAVLRGIDRLSEATGYLSGICILVSTVVVCYAVLLRATGNSTVWQTELAVYLLIVVTFVGAAYGLKHGAHVNVEVLADRLPERGRLILEIVRAVLSLVLIVVVAWYATQMWWEAVATGSTSGTAWDPPLKYVYAILPLGMALVALQYVAIIARRARALTRSSRVLGERDS